MPQIHSLRIRFQSVEHIRGKAGGKIERHERGLAGPETLQREQLGEVEGKGDGCVGSDLGGGSVRRRGSWELDGRREADISAGIVVEVTETGDGELECAGDFVGVG